MAKEKMSIKDLRTKLVENGYNAELVADMTKAELNQHLEGCSEAVKTLEGAIEQSSDPVPLDTIITATTVKQPVAISISSPEWTDYVLKQFVPSELDNGNPKVDGLRRVAFSLLGSFDSFTDVVQVPSVENAGRATVVVKLAFTEGLKRHVQGSADVYSGNTAEPFAEHAVATAETRAEGRALRKALMLTKVLAAEETYNAASDEASASSQRISTGMLNGLKVMSDKAGVDPIKLAKSLGYDIVDLQQLTASQGMELSDKIVKFRTQEEVIPDDIKC
jgi:hypothetical protein